MEFLGETDDRKAAGRKSSVAFDHAYQFPGPTEGAPERGGLLDETLGAAEGGGGRHQQAAAQRDGGKIIVHPQFGIAPIALVRLVTDSEVEAAKAGFDRMAEQIIEMRAPRTEARELAVVIARYDEIIAVTKAKPEIGRGHGRANIEPAHVREAMQRRIGGDGVEKLSVARPRKEV